MKRDKYGRNSILTTDEYIESLPEKFKEKYDYQDTIYKGSREAIEFLCPIHGLQTMKANKHKSSKHGCRLCAKECASYLKKKKGYNSFVSKSKEVHGDKYDYTLVNYICSTENVEIVCPIHGSFFQTPHKHRTSGCSKCSKEKHISALRKTEADMLKESRSKFGNKFELDLTNYVNLYSPIKIKCPVHGWVEYKWNLHISSDLGCPECFKESEKRSNNRISLEDSIQRLTNLYGEDYHFFTEDIRSGQEKVRYYCPKHKILNATALRHLWDGHACPECGRDKGKTKLSGFYNKTVIERKKQFYKNDPNNLYLFHLEDNKYKVGIAKTVRDRLTSIKCEGGFIKPSVILTLQGNTYDIFYSEQKLLKLFKPYKYLYDKPFKGYTEVLELSDSLLKDLIVAFKAENNNGI